MEEKIFTRSGAQKSAIESEAHGRGGHGLFFAMLRLNPQYSFSVDCVRTPTGENLMTSSSVQSSVLFTVCEVLTHFATTLLSDKVSLAVGGPSRVTTSSYFATPSWEFQYASFFFAALVQPVMQGMTVHSANTNAIETATGRVALFMSPPLPAEMKTSPHFETAFFNQFTAPSWNVNGSRC
ncbi:MAG: hypothetical protein ACM337_03975 [Syntrophaceae bacterium]